jgi:hypothetical protein
MIRHATQALALRAGMLKKSCSGYSSLSASMKKSESKEAFHKK